MKKLTFCFSNILFSSSLIISPHNTIECVDGILSILMMHCMSRYDIPELRYHHLSRTPPYHSTIPVVYP